MSLLLAFLLACATDIPDKPDPEPSGETLHAEQAPFPYDWEQIREATKNGRSYVFDLAGGSTLTMTFSSVGEEQTTITSTTTIEGQPPKNTTTVSTWAELQAHASYPAPATTITETEIEVPAGSYKAKLYTVKADDGSTKTEAWFANDLPGAPVKMVEYEDGEVVFSMTLSSYAAGPE